MNGRIVLTGATGFVGRNLYPMLTRTGREVVCASRNPEAAAEREPAKSWVRLDVDDPNTVRDLLQPGDRVFFLVHAMASGDDYAEREARSAKAFATIAAERGVERIVYLGGPNPPGEPSKHLASRLRTGELLREGDVSTIELRAGMIIGTGSESWRITRDLAARLPVMLLPAWLRNQCEPIGVKDVVAALVHAIDAPNELSGAWDIPGPERLTYQEVLYRVAAQRGTKPLGINIPLLSPRLSSHWLRLVTRADMRLARELVDGLAYDLVTDGEGYFANMQDYERMSFDTAVRLALRGEARQLPVSTTFVESLIRRIAPSA